MTAFAGGRTIEVNRRHRAPSSAFRLRREMYLPGIAVPLGVVALTWLLQRVCCLPEPRKDPDRMDRASRV